MRILMITPSLPSPLHRIRSLNLIKAFKRLGYKVFLFSLLVYEKEKGYVNRVKNLVDGSLIIDYPFERGVKNIWRYFYLWPIYPWEYLFLKDRRLTSKLRQFVNQILPDLIYIKRLRTLAFSNELIDHYPALLDTTDAMSLFYRGYSQFVSGKGKVIGWHEYRTYLMLERQVRNKNLDLIWVVCSQRDKEYLQAQAKVKQVWVWPNIVGDDFIDSVGKIGSLPIQDQYKHKGKERRVVFSGLMDKAINYLPALEVIDTIWPQVRKLIPQAKLDIIGPNPVNKLRIKDEVNGVRVLGFVDSLKPYLKQADVYLAWGQTLSGSRNKVLQAAASGLPIIAKKEMLAGLDHWQGVILTVDDPTELADTLIKVLTNERLRTKLGLKAYRWVNRYYNLKTLSDIIKSDLKLYLK